MAVRDAIQLVKMVLWEKKKTAKCAGDMGSNLWVYGKGVEDEVWIKPVANGLQSIEVKKEVPQ